MTDLMANLTPHKGTVRVWVERYAYPRITKEIDVPATIVGDIAIHRRVFWGQGEYPVQPDSKRAELTATHVPSGLPAFPHRLNKPKKAALVHIVQEWQNACPEFFEAARGDMSEIPKDLIAKAQETFDDVIMKGGWA